LHCSSLIVRRSDLAVHRGSLVLRSGYLALRRSDLLSEFRGLVLNRL
jgi:hypothetical protein